MRGGSSILIACGHIRPVVGWFIRDHSHADFHELIVVLGGKIETQICGRTLVGQKGDILFYPCGQVHRERSVGEELLKTIFFAWRKTSDLPTEDWPLTSFDHDNRIEYLARWMLDIQPGRTEEEKRLIDSLLYAALYKYSHPLPSQDSEIVTDIKRHILANLAKPLTLEDLAAVSGFSKYHFSRLFRRAAGQSPMSFLRRVRMEAARTLLLATPLPLKAIAPQVGMANEYHLSRTFKKVFGQSPSILRTGKIASPQESKRTRGRS